MKLSREAIQRMVGGVGMGSVSSGGGGEGFDGGATKAWVNTNFVSIEFFGRLFKAYGPGEKEGDPDVEVLPNDMDSTISNIKAMFGFWTDFYLTALGNGGEIGASIYLAGLKDVNVAGVKTGQVLTWNAASNEWIATTPQSGVDMSQVWNALAAQTSQQINASHLATALAGYATQTWVGQQGFATTAWVNQQGFSTTSWVNSQLANYLPLAGGAMVAGARISSSGGNLYIGNSNNAGWLMLQDVCSQNGNDYWRIYASGMATFANVLSNGYVTALYNSELSDQREKNIIENFEVSLKYIAEAPVVSYTWKDTERRGDKQHIGAIAQYWLREMPELVPEGNGRYTMDYGRIALLSAIMTARHVVNLEQRIAELEKTLRGE